MALYLELATKHADPLAGPAPQRFECGRVEPTPEVPDPQIDFRVSRAIFEDEEAQRTRPFAVLPFCSVQDPQGSRSAALDRWSSSTNKSVLLQSLSSTTTLRESWKREIEGIPPPKQLSN
jgi:hypothetical protein